MTKPGTRFESPKAKATREKLFKTAMLLYEKRGYERVTVDEICGRADVCRATFYNHFSSKDQIVIEFFLENDLYFHGLNEEISRFRTTREKLSALGDAVFARMREQGISLLKPVYHSQISPSVRSASMARRRRPIYWMLEKLVEEGQRRGEIRTDRTCEEIAQAVIMSLRGVIYEWCLFDGKFDIEKAGKSVQGFLMDAMLTR